MKTLYVKGPKDGKLRRVEHLPVDMKTRHTQEGDAHCMMRMQLDNGEWQHRVVRSSRIIERKETRYGYPGLESLGELASGANAH